MKIRILSDLHMEFGPFEVPELDTDPETTLVLAGDINVGDQAYPFIEEMCERFEHVIYVLGNHEFYNKDIQNVRDWWQWANNDNLTVLDDNAVILDDVLFVGGTLWTDFKLDNNENEWFAKQTAKQGMNDFQVIHSDGLRINPDDTVKLHQKTRAFIEQQIQNTTDVRKKVVVTHHLPHPDCIDPRFATSKLNPAFASNLTELFDLDIDIWIHGHTHSVIDREVNGTRILCNPGGYPPRERAMNNHNPILLVEV